MTYKVQLVSQMNAGIFIVSLILLVVLSIVIFVPQGGFHGDGPPIFTFSISAISILFLWQKIVTGRSEWTIDEKRIQIVWTRNFLFWNNQDKVLNWSEIEEIRKGYDTHYHVLKIKLVSGNKLKYFHSIHTRRDEFEEMFRILCETFEAKRNQLEQRLS